MSNSAIFDSKLLDVSAIPCAEKHQVIFDRWNDLPTGDYFVLQNRKDPVPLRNYFEAKLPGCFSWEYLSVLPEAVQIKISKLSAAPKVTEFPSCQGHS